MKMRHFLLTLLMLAVSMTAARADYLYWQLDATEIADFSSAANYAVVHFVNESGNDSTLTSRDGGDPIPTESGFTYDNGMHIANEALLDYAVNIDVSAFSGAAGYFYIELVNYDSASGTAKSIATSEHATYASLSDAISGSLGNIPTAWTGGQFYPVPEPTAGLLAMLGLGIAALRRRRRG